MVYYIDFGLLRNGYLNRDIFIREFLPGEVPMNLIKEGVVVDNSVEVYGATAKQKLCVHTSSLKSNMLSAPFAKLAYSNQSTLTTIVGDLYAMPKTSFYKIFSAHKKFFKSLVNDISPTSIANGNLILPKEYENLLEEGERGTPINYITGTTEFSLGIMARHNDASAVSSWKNTVKNATQY